MGCCHLVAHFRGWSGTLAREPWYLRQVCVYALIVEGQPLLSWCRLCLVHHQLLVELITEVAQRHLMLLSLYPDSTWRGLPGWSSNDARSEKARFCIDILSRPSLEQRAPRQIVYGLHGGWGAAIFRPGRELLLVVAKLRLRLLTNSYHIEINLFFFLSL